MIAISSATVVWVVAALRDRTSAAGSEGLTGFLVVLLLAYLGCVLVLAAAHHRIRHRGVGHASEHPGMAGLVTVGVGTGALGYADGGGMSGAVLPGAAGMAVWWVLYVVVRSQIGSRSLTPEHWRQAMPPGVDQLATTVPSSSSTDAISEGQLSEPPGPDPEPAPKPVGSRIAAVVGAGLLALGVAIAKHLESWVAVPIVLIGAIAIPLVVTWLDQRARPPESLEAAGQTVASEDGWPPTRRHHGAPPTRHFPGSDQGGGQAPLQLSIRPRGPRWWGGILLALSLLMVAMAIGESRSTLDTFAPVALGLGGVLLAWVAALQFRVGLVANQSGVIITNTFREVIIPWSHLESIEFEGLPANGFGLDFHKLVFVTREGRRLPAESPTGAIDPGTYLVDVRHALTTMLDGHRQRQ
ncbi:hypothetical protein ASG91_11425 [Phycicoccus sp. Soil802]|nr:hypothetical protein ASG91_11425 [Phycicoccus sp. Soil802]